LPSFLFITRDEKDDILWQDARWERCELAACSIQPHGHGYTRDWWTGPRPLPRRVRSKTR
jgi:hypothetical protein